MTSPLLTIVIPSRRPQQLKGLLDNLERVTADYSRVEVVVKVDDDVSDAIDTMEREKARRPFRIRYVCSPRHSGVFTLWAAQNEAFEIADAQSYFFLFASDEIRILTKNWDRVLEKYVGFFEDDIFRLRVSFCKYRNYHKLFDCTYMPESFALMTGKWMHVTGGTGHCWGTDAYHQCIAYHLSAGPGGDRNLWHQEGMWRDVQIHDIEFGGIEFGKDISAREHFARNLRISREWDRLCTYGSQLHFAYLARRLSLYCKAHEAGLRKFSIIDRRRRKVAVLVDKETDEGITAESYALPRFKIWWENLRRRLVTAPRRIWWFCYISAYILAYPKDRLSEPLMDGDEFSVYLRKNRPLVYLSARAARSLKQLTPRRLAKRLGVIALVDLAKNSFRYIGRTLLRLNRGTVGKPRIPTGRFPVAAGLEARFNPIVAVVNNLMRRIGYPVADRSRLKRAFGRILITADTLERWEYGTRAPTLIGSLDRLNPDLTSELTPLMKAINLDPEQDDAPEIKFGVISEKIELTERASESLASELTPLMKAINLDPEQDDAPEIKFYKKVTNT